MPLMTRNAYAKHRGCSTTYIYKLCKMGRIPLIDGKVDSEKADAELNKSNGNGNGNGKERAPSYWTERARHEKHKADLAEMELAKKSGELVLMSEVEHYVAGMLHCFREKMLYFPTKLSPSLVNKTDYEIHRILDDNVREALEEMSAAKFDEGKKLWVT